MGGERGRCRPHQKTPQHIITSIIHDPTDTIITATTVHSTSHQLKQIELEMSTSSSSPEDEYRRPIINIGFDQQFYESSDVIPLDKLPASSTAGYTVHENLTDSQEEPNCSRFAATSYLKTSGLDSNYIKSEDMSNTFHLVPQAAVEIEMHEVGDSQGENYECITLLDMDEANEKTKSLNRRPTDIKTEFVQHDLNLEKPNFERTNLQSFVNPISSLERTELKVVDEHYVLCPTQVGQSDNELKKTLGDRKTCPICFKTITSKNYARHRRTHPGAQGNFTRGANQFWLAEGTSSVYNADT